MKQKWKVDNDLKLNPEFKVFLEELEKTDKKPSSIIIETLFNRGFRNAKQVEKFFDFDYDKDVADPFLFSDMEKAVDRIAKAKSADEKIAVFGDYDADGVTATVLVVEALEELGFAKVIPYIPDRQLEGYGMNNEAINFLSKEKISLIITVDCGITNGEEVEFARQRGIDVIVVDHHHVSTEIPKAVAVINPQIEGCGYNFKSLAGVGVAFKLVQALYQKMSPKTADQLKWFLDLVAIGTVADCVPLLGENRVLVRYGLIVLSKTRRPGLKEMFQVGRIVIDEDNIPDTQKIAFQISPRINAAGRMDHASVSYELIKEKDRVKARVMALEIEDKNQDRQKMTAEIVREIRIIAENSFREKKLILAENENWRVGILGLLAGKICDEFGKPTAIFQKQEKEFVGSFRSIPQLNIIEALKKCSGLLNKFGGHAQAAGVSVARENMEKFYAKLSAIIEAELAGKDITPELSIDAEIKPEDIGWELMGEIKQMEPFGEGNAEPVFLMKSMVVEEAKIVGNGNRHLKLALRPKSESPKIFDAIGFRLGDKFPGIKKGDTLDIVFNLQEDEWNGNKKMQLKLIDLKLIQ